MRITFGSDYLMVTVGLACKFTRGAPISPISNETQSEYLSKYRNVSATRKPISKKACPPNSRIQALDSLVAAGILSRRGISATNLPGESHFLRLRDFSSEFHFAS